jgi:diaminopimelate decarboxylase
MSCLCLLVASRCSHIFASPKLSSPRLTCQCFYFLQCNPDPVIVRTLAVLGVNFDCASRNEIRLVQEQSADLPRKPDIIFANPCKARAHILEAVCKGVKRMTFDNIAEVQKIASISKNIELVLRIATDDRGSLCRLSSKFGAPRSMWKPLLACAKENGIQVVGVSFHVGSGCRDASRYELALKDARKIFDMAKAEFGFDMKLLDIGGGFPGETHGLWNPQVIEEDSDVVAVVDPKEGYNSDEDDKANNVFMFFNEIAEQVAPIIDQVFPVEEGVRIIGEPGRYFVAACATLCCSVISVRTNGVGDDFVPEAIDDNETAQALNDMTREEEDELVRGQSVRMEKSLRKMSESGDGDTAIDSVMDSLGDYAALFARRQLVQQEADVYNDSIDFFHQDLDTAMDMLGPPTEDQQETMRHTVEGMNYPLVASNENEESGVFITLATAGEAAVSGVVMQAVADASPMQDDFAYYINDGVYGAFNNIMFDHATVRPRVLRGEHGKTFAVTDDDGYRMLESKSDSSDEMKNQSLFASTVFGPTCDSIDVVARSVLLPKMKIGDWLYFNNMGAYTMAASSSFNGFVPSEIFYVCSVQPEYFEALIAGPDTSGDDEAGREEKKDE